METSYVKVCVFTSGAWLGSGNYGIANPSQLHQIIENKPQAHVCLRIIIKWHPQRFGRMCQGFPAKIDLLFWPCEMSCCFYMFAAFHTLSFGCEPSRSDTTCGEGVAIDRCVLSLSIGKTWKFTLCRIWCMHLCISLSLSLSLSLYIWAISFDELVSWTFPFPHHGYIHVCFP